MLGQVIQEKDQVSQDNASPISLGKNSCFKNFPGWAPKTCDECVTNFININHGIYFLKSGLSLKF